MYIFIRYRFYYGKNELTDDMQKQCEKYLEILKIRKEKYKNRNWNSL